MKQQNKDVSFQHEDYGPFYQRAKLVSDVVANKVKTSAEAKKYLPPLNPHDQSEQNTHRNKAYRERAVFTNFTGNTQRGMVGLAFKHEPTIDLPGNLESLQDNVDGAGNSMAQQSRRVLGAVLAKGRHGLLVDYPRVEGTPTIAEQRARNIRPFIVSIDALRITNWKVGEVDGEFVLTLVAYQDDQKVTGADGFSEETVEQYRALLLEDGKYLQRVYRKNDSGDWVQEGDDIVPTQANGQPWNRIPFTFVGAENNDAAVDDSPLYDMAVINIGHYRNSADYEDSCFITGQPQFWASGIDEGYYGFLKEKEVYVGSRELFPVPPGGQLGVVQPQPNSMPREAMQDKEGTMQAMGARMLAAGSAAKTATEAGGDLEREHSVLSLAVSNVSAAYVWCIEMAGLFSGDAITADEPFAISQEFIQLTIDAGMLRELSAALMAGHYPRSEFWDQLRRGGLIDPEKTDEEIQDEIDSQTPTTDLDDDDSVTDAE